MSHTIHKTYRGWDITIRCSLRSGVNSDSAPGEYTAISEAQLQPSEDPCIWIDPRIQLMSTGNDFFESGILCEEDILSQMKELIDALAR